MSSGRKEERSNIRPTLRPQTTKISGLTKTPGLPEAQVPPAVELVLVGLRVPVDVATGERVARTQSPPVVREPGPPPETETAHGRSLRALQGLVRVGRGDAGVPPVGLPDGLVQVCQERPVALPDTPVNQVHEGPFKGLKMTFPPSGRGFNLGEVQSDLTITDIPFRESIID